ncbi:MAG: DUF4230 domain-containing protein [Bacteroidales bacterium]|nr:DUF4230 domain-containing protein [Bacteroidales bacterium]MCM1146906.1 DUF4230 domain-containing protein [Bacteroidales bacterium]MCM1205596.1 DUF4230 domain-containing protein [Bacillota bacterium]MCM1510293.1 DUF4230 domain-containing protein [Clostridium sp.]
MNILKRYLYMALAAVALLAVLWLGMKWMLNGSGISTSQEERVEQTAAVMDSIRSIGQWELTYIDTNVQVDTVVKRWFGFVNDKLQRRYYGRLSVGIDMQKLPEEWCLRSNDTVRLTLPDVCLLDSNFIDESRTVLVLSENDDIEADKSMKKAMLERAGEKMIRTAVTPQVLSDARRLATDKLSRRFQAVGYEQVIVEFR